VRTGTWKTQTHNEPILDQAFRTSNEVYLIFGANRSGEFFGYAKMIEPINKERANRSKSSKFNSSSSKMSARGIREEDEEDDSCLLSPSFEHPRASSPSELTPYEPPTQDVHHEGRRTDPYNKLRAVEPSSFRAQTLDPSTLRPSYFPPLPIARAMVDDDTDVQQSMGSSNRAQEEDADGIKRKDTILSPEEKAERTERTDRDNDQDKEGPDVSAESWGGAFRLQWVKVGGLPFGRTRQFRNPWNGDREVKVSRDGTEVEPSECLRGRD
jgi:hypothetical protein